MLRSRRVLVVLAIVGAAPVVASVASAEAPPDPGCPGEEVASRNDISGIFGASENPEASAGPGYFLGQATAEAVLDAMSFCG